MQIAASTYSIAEIIEKIERRDLSVNTNYQRGTDLWPSGPRTYFIDTIMRKFPFPKIYFYEEYDRATSRTRMEIVDGQQRISAIRAFVRDEFMMPSGHEFARLKYSQLPEDVQRDFMMYGVSVDVIRNATHAEIVEMFRRMNAYTLPLNGAEKRHAGFQGEFKWAMHNTATALGEFFDNFGVFTNRQMIRMADQEFVAEIFAFTQLGIVSTSPSTLTKIYKEHDVDFPQSEEFVSMLMKSVDFITSRLPALRGTFMMKPYACHTLLCALIFNRFGVPDRDLAPFVSHGRFANSPGEAEQRLLVLAAAHEANETEGPYRDYVFGASSGTNRIVQRTERFRAVLAALQE